MQIPTLRLALLLALLPLAAPAETPSPATFEHEDRALATLIEFPELRGDARAVIRCVAVIERDGKFDRSGCYETQPSDQVVIAAIGKATKKARMTPARFDGRGREVYVQYRGLIERKGDENTVVIYNNPGLTENVEAYGEAHVAAQRALTNEEWMQVCPQQTRFLVWAKAHVDESGRQSSISLIPGEGSPPITEKCRAGIVATLEASAFTPAYADGEPVPSSFIEPFGN